MSENRGAWKEHDELTVAFAKILYAWQHPEVLTSATGLEEQKGAVQSYFHNDPMAYHVLKSLVVTALKLREFAHLSEGERRREMARREMEMQRILADVEAHPIGTPLITPRPE